MKYVNIGIARENESPENPGALEKRVALVPNDVRRLVEYGCKVFVEEGAGNAMGYADSEYVCVGAEVQTYDEIYSDKDLVIKLKGPTIDDIPKMRKGSALLCMAHVSSFPERKRLMEENEISLIAMEKILKSPNFIADDVVLSKVAMQQYFYSLAGFPSDFDVVFLGYDPKTIGGIRRAGNRNARTLSLIRSDVSINELEHIGDSSIYVYDSRNVTGSYNLIDHLEKMGCHLLDIAIVEKFHGTELIKKYRRNHPPFDFGKRRIECLEETGIAGARYGLRLLEEIGNVNKKVNELNVCVIGYGNVGMGAIKECDRQGVNKINILTRKTSSKGEIEKYLKDADLVINGAEIPEEDRGKVFLVTKEHVKNVMNEGAVVIDLVGGSSNNRSAIENIVEYTYLTDPFFVEDGVVFSALWGWPMMGLAKESNIKYSKQILSILIEKEMLIDGLDSPSKGIETAIITKF